jgi:uncharacterized membrane protein
MARMNGWTIAGTSFLACGVEMVEALTIVLAVGVTRGWRAALTGAAWAIAALAAIVILARPVLVWLEPLPAFKIAVGLVAIYYGATWLRKAILRASGRMALRDEDKAYAKQRTALASVDARGAFLASFNGVFLEGTEVVIIVLAFAAGAAAALPWATGGALVALLLVVALGLALHAPLARVPENAMKYVVGTMLSTFGIFWIGEGAGIAWWGDDAAIGLIALLILAASLGAVRVLKARVTAQ